MSREPQNEGELKLKIGGGAVRVLYRRPSPAEVLETLVKKMPRGGEEEDAQRILLANLELGKSCITGIREGDLIINGRDLGRRRGDTLEAWKKLIAELVPLILIALGQFLSAVPEVLTGDGPKKS